VGDDAGAWGAHAVALEDVAGGVELLVQTC
jgi:hypothetical protein